MALCEPLTSTIAVVGSIGGLSTGARTPEGLQRISEANLKHGRQTKDKLAAQRHAAKVGLRVRGELKLIERQIVNAGLMPDESDFTEVLILVCIRPIRR